MQTPRRTPLLFVIASLWLWIGSPASAQPTFPKANHHEPTEAERGEIRARVQKLDAELGKLSARPISRDLADDIGICLKAGNRALDFNEFFEKKDVATTIAALDRGLQRAAEFNRPGPGSWTLARGAIGRGFTSKIDGSIQPYGVIVPEALEFSLEKRARLDVVLHGRDQSISEARFLGRFDGKPAAPGDAGKITLHIFGRGNNAYRWAGETDVFEAIDAVRRNYPIDDRRIVLRGFSMGGAGAWHLGLHHPSMWSSVEAGAGFSETKTYAKLKNPPDYQVKTLSIYDSVDYALNAFDVPIVGYGGEDDPQLQASTNIVEGLKRLGFALKTEGLITKGEGIDFLRVVGAKMGHKVDPSSAKLMASFHDERAKLGANLNPKRIRFVTYTTKYGRAGWLRVEQLVEHYKRTEVDAEILGNQVVVHKAENVAMLAVDRHSAESIDLEGESFPLEPAVQGLLPNVYFARAEDGWKVLDYEESRAFEKGLQRVKRRGLQGPIDDAFTGPFLCVRGTGTPWNAAVGRWTNDRLETFEKDWNFWMRGKARVVKDTEVELRDLALNNLILFGDPGSNSYIDRVLKNLPGLSWTRAEIVMVGKTYSAADHVPVMIAPNPLNPQRYVVLNSGHTFGADAFAGTNALLYPRLGDFAVFQTDGRNGSVKASGFFDEGWGDGLSRGR